MKNRLKKIARSNKGLGLNELIGIAAALILAAFIIIPGLMDFGDRVMEKMNTWWDEVSQEIFVNQIDD